MNEYNKEHFRLKLDADDFRRELLALRDGGLVFRLDDVLTAIEQMRDYDKATTSDVVARAADIARRRIAATSNERFSQREL